MMGLWGYLLSFGRPKDLPKRQWEEITLTRCKVKELERRIRRCELDHTTLRCRVKLATGGAGVEPHEEQVS